VNVEHWLIDRPMPRQVLSPPTGAALLPDVQNWAWHRYGMRVGFWRFLAAFQKRGIWPTLSCNALVCLEYPRVAAAARDAGWDFMGHGFFQEPSHRVVDQRDMIFRSVETIVASPAHRCADGSGRAHPDAGDAGPAREAGIQDIGD
jgi:allantoinase